MNQNAHFIVFYNNENKFSNYPKKYIKIYIGLYLMIFSTRRFLKSIVIFHQGGKLFIHQISSNYFGCSILTCTWLFMHLLITQHISFIYKRKLITANLKSSCIHILTVGEHNRIFFVLLKIIIKNLLKQLVRRTPQNDEVKRQIWFLLCLCDIQKRIRQALPLQYKRL